LVAKQNKLQHHIKEIGESIRIISELSNGQLQVHNATPQPPNMVAESL
jgi:dihydroxyacetone kinase-like predicted kinase